MSKYTTQLRYICEQKAGYTESTDDYTAVINSSYDQIIHPDTALYDPAYAPVLYKKIIRHYYFDEIGHETVAQFIMRLNLKLDEILPYYNKLYESAALSFNPLYDVDYTVEGTKEDNNTAASTRTDNLHSLRTDALMTETDRNLLDERTDNLHSIRTDNLQKETNINQTAQRTDDLASHSESTQTDVYSDTPEGSLSGVNNNSYLSNARKIDSEADGTNTGTQLNEQTGVTVEENTGTQRSDNTGTQTTEQSGSIVEENTGTQSIDNTGTQTNNDIIHNENEYFEHVTGKRGGTDYADLIRKFRDTFINIDMMIINDLQSLFMGVY